MSEDEKKPGMTVAEAGRRGGKRVAEKYGKGFYSEIGKKGGEASKARHAGTNFYQEIGRKGGTTLRDSAPPNHYSEIGKKGGATVRDSAAPGFYSEIGKKGGHRVRDLIAAGKILQAAGDPTVEEALKKTDALEPEEEE